jgi:hypothetical protein
MVLPVLGALLGAAGTIGGAFMGGQAQNAATMWNWAANERNRRDANKERRESREYAEEIRDEQKLGGTNAMGDRSYFDEDKGWVVELGNDSQELIDYFFQQELPARRAQFNRKDTASRGNQDLARALEGEFRRTRPDDPNELENIFYAQASRGIGDATADALGAAGRDSLRKGSSNFSKTAGEIAEAGMRERGNAAMNSKLQAEDYSREKFGAERAQLASLMQMFQGAANQDIGASYDPSNERGAGNALMQLFQQGAAQGNSIGASAVNKQGGRSDYIEPALGMANALGAAGTAIAGAGERIGAASNRNSLQDMMMQYITQRGGMPLENGGMFGAMNDRLRPGVGGF